MNSIWKKRLYCGLLLACERPTGHQSISPIPQSKGYRFSFILWGGYFRHLRAFCGLKLIFFASFRLKCVLATRDVCKRPRRLHHWNRHSISDPMIPHIAVYNTYRFVTERINTSTVFVQVSDRVIGTGQTPPVENQLAIFRGTLHANIKTTTRMWRKHSFYSYNFQEDTFRDCGEISDWNTVKLSKVPMFPHRRWEAAATYYHHAKLKLITVCNNNKKNPKG